jgi:hypothetical protein
VSPALLAVSALDLVGELLARLSRLAGRVIWNGWPTGVSVTWAQRHGGPWPDTTGGAAYIGSHHFC